MAKIELLDGTIKEVNLPYYCTDGICHVYKIFSESKCIAICTDSAMLSTGICFSGLPFSLSTPVIEVPEHEYTDAINYVTQKLLAK